MSLAGSAVEPLLHALARVESRAQAAQELASALGAEQLLLYVRDPQLHVMLPAPGMPKTLAGGPGWRAFLRRCLGEPGPAGMVDLPAGTERPARAIVRDNAALILVGGSPDASGLHTLEENLPLLAALLVAQQSLHVERAESAAARDAAAQAHDLAKALDRSRAATAELNRQLRQEHERKDEFLAVLSHELRNPLSPLVHSVEILRHTVSADRRVGRHLDVMERQLQQLTHLVDDLLDVSRVSRGLIELRRAQVLLQDILDDAVEAARPLIEGRGHVLQRNELPAGLLVHADRVRLTQVFANLLSNAAKYTDPGGRISVSVVSDQRRVSVVVQDNGIGIPPDMLSRVFDMFTQVPGARARSQGGLGIGLTLARRLVELHGGRMTAHSRGEGRGSTFTVSLPQLVVGQARTHPEQGPVAVRAPAGGGRDRLRVLVVDDNVDGAEAMAALIGYMGAEVRIAGDGRQALREAAAYEPRLVLLDIGLPGMDGYETARCLRDLPGMRARVVALTGYGSVQDRERALAAGFDDHLVKPVPVDRMQRLLQEVEAMHEGS